MQLILTIPDSSVYGITAARTTYNAGLPVTVLQNGAPVANPALIASDADYVSYVLSQAVTSWCAQANVAPPPPPPPVTVINGVPQEVTRRQGVQALINTGHYAAIKPAIDAITDPVQKATMQNEWDNSTTFQRQRVSLIAMATAIGLGSTDVDNLFKLAATL